MRFLADCLENSSAFLSCLIRVTWPFHLPAALCRQSVDHLSRPLLTALLCSHLTFHSWNTWRVVLSSWCDTCCFRMSLYGLSQNYLRINTLLTRMNKVRNIQQTVLNQICQKDYATLDTLNACQQHVFLRLHWKGELKATDQWEDHLRDGQTVFKQTAHITEKLMFISRGQPCSQRSSKLAGTWSGCHHSTLCWSERHSQGRLRSLLFSLPL